MVLMLTQLNVSDNTGVRVIKCIKILGKKKEGFIGDFIIGSVQRYNPKKKFKKGDILFCLLIRQKKIFRKFNNIFIKFSKNSVILLNKREIPVGTRIYGPVLEELRNFSGLRILSLGVFFV